MASSLYNELRAARDERGIAPDATDGVLLLVARSGTSDPARLAEMLGNKGVTLAPASVEALAALVAASTGRTPTPPPPPPARSNGAPGPMSFLTRLDDRPTSDAVSSVVPDAQPAEAPVRVEGSPRRRNRRGLSEAHGALLAAEGRSSTSPPLPSPPPPAAERPVAPPPRTAEPAPAEGTTPERLEEAAAEPAPTPEPTLADYSDDVDMFAARENAVSARPGAPGAVDLSWPALDPAGRPLVYLVVSSASGVPVRPSAGTRLLLSAQPRAEVPVGAGPYFSVFSYSAPDADALPSTSPVLHAAGRVAPEVANLRVSTHPDAVVLSWTAPSGVDRVRVLRGLPEEHLPPHFDAGLEIPSNPEFARDTGVLPGRRYEYRVLTQFVDTNTGNRTLSTGVEAVAVIPATPEPVTDLSAEVSGDSAVARIELRWQTPELGRVVIYEANSAPQHAATGRVITLDQLDQLPLGEPVKEPTLFDGPTSVVPSIPFRLTDGPRRTFTPVTVIGEQAAVGQAAVVNLLGRVTETEVIERVDWQLLRFAWPVGASFVEVERGARGAAPDGTAPVRISQQEYDRLGGLRMQLPMEGCDLHVRGSVTFGGEWTRGPVTTVSYPGRWILRYRFEKVGLLGRRRELQLQVDRGWPDFTVAMVRNTGRLPLTHLEFSERPTPFPVRGAMLTPGDWVTVTELPAEEPGFTRLFAYHADFTPIVVDPPMAPRPGDAAPRLLTPGELRCVTCTATQPVVPQLFRCTGNCPPGIDPALSQFRGEEVRARPLFQGPGAPMDAVACPTCSTPSREVLCLACHSPLPARSAETDPVSVTVVGARGTGKTTYLVSLCDWIEEVWGPATGAPATPLDARTAGRLRQMRESLDEGLVVGSTPRVEQNPDLLAPLLIGLDAPRGRLRTLALYDVAGEDVQDPERVAPYGPTLARADALLFMLDPLQIPDVRLFLEGQITLPAVAGNPVSVMSNVITEIRRRTRSSGGPLPMPVMVAVSKLDGIHRAVRTPGTDLTGLLNGGSALMYDRTPAASLLLEPSDQRQVHEETRSLLQRLGANQFLALVERSFARTEYFSISALGHAPAGDTTLSQAGISSFRVADPLRWLVTRRWLGR
ncbi:hypothetical protein ACI797_27225 [Geodermatophilus sp. SYSU D00691]